MNENIYDGYGIISSELLKKKVKGFKQGQIVNLDKGIMCNTELFQFDSNLNKRCEKFVPKNIYELSIV